MRSRAAGGLEPDDDDQRELVELWHLSHGAENPHGVLVRGLDPAREDRMRRLA